MSDTTRMISQAVIAGLVAALALFLIASMAEAQWGGGGSTTTPTEEPATEAPAAEDGTMSTSAVDDPCALVTAGEASELFGTTVTTTGDSNQCTYLTTDISGRSLTVTAAPDLPGTSGVAPAMQQLADSLGGTVSDGNVGVESHIVISEAVAELTALNADNELLVIVMTMPEGSPAQITAQLNDLGNTALARI